MPCDARECGARGLQGSCMGDGLGCVVGAVGACMCLGEWRRVKVVVRSPGRGRRLGGVLPVVGTRWAFHRLHIMSIVLMA